MFLVHSYTLRTTDVMLSARGVGKCDRQCRDSFVRNGRGRNWQRDVGRHLPTGWPMHPVQDHQERLWNWRLAGIGNGDLYRRVGLRNVTRQADSLDLAVVGLGLTRQWDRRRRDEARRAPLLVAPGSGAVPQPSAPISTQSMGVIGLSTPRLTPVLNASGGPLRSQSPGSPEDIGLKLPRLVFPLSTEK
jgi:hypothetical protein